MKRWIAMLAVSGLLCAGVYWYLVATGRIIPFTAAADVPGQVVAKVEMQDGWAALLVRYESGATTNGPSTRYYAYLARRSGTTWKIHNEPESSREWQTEGVPLRWASTIYRQNGERLLIWGGVVEDSNVKQILAKEHTYDVSENPYYLFVWHGAQDEFDFTPASALSATGTALYAVQANPIAHGWRRAAPQ